MFLNNVGLLFFQTTLVISLRVSILCMKTKLLFFSEKVKSVKNAGV